MAVTPSTSPVDGKRFSPDQYRSAITITAVLLIGIMLTGAAVRLTASGLGCEDWPGCTEDRFVPELSLHPWIEFGNRLVSGAVGFAVAITALGAYRRSPRRQDLIAPAWGLVIGVVAQILLGLVTVRFELHPVTVSLHFLLSIALLWNVLLLLDRAGDVEGTSAPRVEARLVTLGRVVLTCAVAVLVLGTVVTGTGPHSGDSRADRLPFDLDRVVQIHSVSAWLLVATTVALSVGLVRSGRAPEAATAARRAVAVCLAQGALGYVQYFVGVPALLVFFHVAGSIAVFMAIATLYLALFDRRADGLGTPASSTVDDRTPATSS